MSEEFYIPPPPPPSEGVTNQGRKKRKRGGRTKRKYDNSNRRITAEIRRVQRECNKALMESQKIHPEQGQRYGNVDTRETIGEVPRGPRNGILGGRVVWKRIYRAEAINRYFPDRQCPLCFKIKTSTKQWIIEGPFGSMCLTCYRNLLKQVPRRQAWINAMLEQADKPFPDNSYSGEALVNTFGRLNPIGLACKLSGLGSVCRQGYMIGKTLYLMNGFPPEVASWYGLATKFGRFGDQHRPWGYSSLLEMCKANEPFDRVAEALKSNHLWKIKLPFEVEWWNVTVKVNNKGSKNVDNILAEIRGQTAAVAGNDTTADVPSPTGGASQSNAEIRSQ